MYRCTYNRYVCVHDIYIYTYIYIICNIHIYIYVCMYPVRICTRIRVCVYAVLYLYTWEMKTHMCMSQVSDDPSGSADPAKRYRLWVEMAAIKRGCASTVWQFRRARVSC